MASVCAPQLRGSGVVRDHRASPQASSEYSYALIDEMPLAVPVKRRQHCRQPKRERRFVVPTVLIVEDNRALADAVAEVLRSIGYRTLIAHDGEAALCEVERSMPEVVIVDLELPAIDGLEVARRLRNDYGKRMRLIANTAWPDNAETHSRTTDAGFDDVLIKPTSIYQILKAIRHSGAQPAL
jgi:CheY-like chemotaxis protein